MTYTNSSLATARRCLREYDLRYPQQLEFDGESSEALQVGSTWAKAFECAGPTGLPPEQGAFDAIEKHAPSPLWAAKLSRLFAAHRWYWRDQPFEYVESERTFYAELADSAFAGKLDGVIKLPDGRVGVLEQKTTGDPLDAESAYWDRLRLDIQVGLYSLAVEPRPDFILYDVTRKPTISPKKLSRAEVARLSAELGRDGVGTYYGEHFSAELLEPVLGSSECRESVGLYGARLTADIGNRPDFYFARREVPRTEDDYAALIDNLTAQVRVIKYAQENDLMHRNPESCNAFGRCTFFGLCSNNIYPLDRVPDGFRRREHLHPELQPERHIETP